MLSVQLHCPTIISCNAVPPSDDPKFRCLKASLPVYLRYLVSKYINIAGVNFSGVSLKHGIQHLVENTSKPTLVKPWCLKAQQLKVAKEEFSKMEAAGIIWLANSPWSIPLHMVPKPNGSWRPCSDYWQLNTKTVPLIITHCQIYELWRHICMAARFLQSWISPRPTTRWRWSPRTSKRPASSPPLTHLCSSRCPLIF